MRDGSPAYARRYGSYRSELRAIRVERGWRVEELAAISGCASSTIKKAEHEPTSMSLRTLVKLAYALGVAPLELLPELAVEPRKPIRLSDEAVHAALRGERLVVAPPPASARD